MPPTLNRTYRLRPLKILYRVLHSHSTVKSYFLLAVVCCSLNVSAGEVDVYGNLRSDYMFQGVSRSNNDVSPLLGMDYLLSADSFTGVWATENKWVASYGYGNEGTLELGYYIGIHHRIADDWHLSSVLSRYEFPESSRVQRNSYSDLMVSIDYAGLVTASFGLNNHYYGAEESTQYIELTSQVALSEDLTMSFGGGYHDVSDIYRDGYFYGNIGFGKQFSDNVMIDVSVVGSDNRGQEIFGERISEPRVVISISLLML